MIIVVGPDSSGKSFLCKVLSMKGGKPRFHYTKDNVYEDYIEPLTNLSMVNAVCDRIWFCEFIYSDVLGRKNIFDTKDFHNLLLVTLAHTPVVVLTTGKRLPYSDTYLPESKWDICLQRYREFLDRHHIRYYEYNWELDDPLRFLDIENEYLKKTDWWPPLWAQGKGTGGNILDPKILVCAQNLGPENLHNIPFEKGVTGYMFSDVITRTNTPLGDIAVTNIVKGIRGGSPTPTAEDIRLFELEVEKMRPGKVILMGKTALRAAAPVLKRANIPYAEIVHLGSLAHKGISDLSGYCEAWKSLLRRPKTIWEM